VKSCLSGLPPQRTPDIVLLFIRKQEASLFPDIDLLGFCIGKEKKVGALGGRD